MIHTPHNTSGRDGETYAKAGGARRARDPISVIELQGGFRKVICFEGSPSWSSGTNIVLEASMTCTLTGQVWFRDVAFFSKTTSLKAWQCKGCSSVFVLASLS